jgi:hypothetical protein
MVFGLDDRDSVPGRDKIFFCSLLCPGWLLGAPNLLSGGYLVLFLMETASVV